MLINEFVGPAELKSHFHKQHNRKRDFSPAFVPQVIDKLRFLLHHSLMRHYTLVSIDVASLAPHIRHALRRKLSKNYIFG